jgi:hypothetical protein
MWMICNAAPKTGNTWVTALVRTSGKIIAGDREGDASLIQPVPDLHLYPDWRKPSVVGTEIARLQSPPCFVSADCRRQPLAALSSKGDIR